MRREKARKKTKELKLAVYISIITFSIALSIYIINYLAYSQAHKEYDYLAFNPKHMHLMMIGITGFGIGLSQIIIQTIFTTPRFKRIYDSAYTLSEKKTLKKTFTITTITCFTISLLLLIIGSNGTIAIKEEQLTHPDKIYTSKKTHISNITSIESISYYDNSLGKTQIDKKIRINLKNQEITFNARMRYNRQILSKTQTERQLMLYCSKNKIKFNKKTIYKQ